MLPSHLAFPEGLHQRLPDHNSYITPAVPLCAVTQLIELLVSQVVWSCSQVELCEYVCVEIERGGVRGRR